ncbi:mechanosensitive ion channel family protein [Sphingomonas sp. BK235]|uniref:mechanosensitive ion channel family protein n=1 Tax=Sphingomonas sp. BK235 TaxID=2512131 RepID=UPI001049FFC5|nr:mechanosensitive ion channel family protein [Sphingomonas sp. BK235]TCP33134.1 small-conductance mechanosensitive channel [Sphingomonas sp. BK235]
MSDSKAAAAKQAVSIDADRVGDQAQALLGASLTWLQQHWLQILIALGIGVAIALLLFWLRAFGPRLARRSASGKGWSAVLGRAVERTNAFFIIMLSARLVSGYAATPPELDATIAFLFKVAVTFQGAIWARELILGAIEHRTRGEHYTGEALMSAMGLIRLLVSVAVFAIALVVVLDNLGVNVTGLVAGLGVGGIAIGLAAQGIFADLFAALAIIFDRPFRRGDKVSYGTTSGVIESIGLKSTRIRAFTGELRIISNRNLLDKEIQNTSLRDHIRVSYTIGVTYETPPDTLARVPAILTELVEAEGAKVARCGFETFGASSLDYALQVDTPGDDWATAHATRDRLMVAIMRRFADEKIGIAYPTQTTYTAAPDGTLVMPYAEAAKE